MRNPQVGENVKCLRTGGFFQVNKVIKDFVVLNSQDGLTQILTPRKNFDLVSGKISPAESFWKDLIPSSESPVLSKGRGS